MVPHESSRSNALMLLSLLFGLATSPTSAFAQGGFDDERFPPPPDEQECLMDAENRLADRQQDAENSLALCLSASGVGNLRTRQ